MAASRDKGTQPPKLEIHLLGRFEVLRDGEPIPEEAWGRRKTKTLLKVLLTDPGRVFTQDQLIDALFGGENVDRATENLYGRVSQLRRALEPDLKRGADSTFVLRKGQGYLFSVDSGAAIDVGAFTGALANALSSREQERWFDAIDAFEDGLLRYRGDLLPEDRYEDWAEARREELRSLHLDGLSQLAECYSRAGRLRQAISCCQKVLSEEPYRESVIRRLMELESASGRRSKALRTYQEGERALREYLDVEPSPATRALFESLSQAGDERTELDPHRLAVIPFVSIGADPTREYLADGMTEALIYALSQVTGLEVIAQTTTRKYKGARKSAAEIGQELRVGSILEGSVQQGNAKAQVLVQLISTESEAHLWARQYALDLEDVLGLQGSIARRVADALKVQLLAREDAALSKDEEVQRAAHTEYLKGKLFLARCTDEGHVKAIEHFERALSIESGYPLALAGLAEAHTKRAGAVPAGTCYEKALHCVHRALELDPDCAEAHSILGFINLLHRGDFREAEREYLLAIELNPNCAQALAWYAMLLSNEERFKDACHWSERALALDPLSADLTRTYAESLHYAGRLVEALDQYQKTLDIDPTHAGAWWGYWYCLAAGWDWERAEAFTRGLVDEHPENPWAYIDLATCVMCRGRLEEGLGYILAMLEQQPEPRPFFVLAHAGHCHHFARRYDEALEFYRQCLERNPTSSMIHNMIAKCYVMQERYQEALDELDAAQRVFRGDDKFWDRHTRMDRGVIYARMGETEKAEAELKAAMQDAGRLNGCIAVAGILYALGREDESYDWYERAATAREPHMAAALKNPRMEGQLSDPRYRAILKRIGLAD